MTSVRKESSRSGSRSGRAHLTRIAPRPGHAAQSGDAAKSKYAKQARYHASHPWVKYISWARRRCADTDSKWYQFYGSKGITCTLTAADAEFLWKRDSAAELKRPSLDRIDSAKNYTLANCRFIEFDDNVAMAWNRDFKWLYEQAACG